MINKREINLLTYLQRGIEKVNKHLVKDGMDLETAIDTAFEETKNEFVVDVTVELLKFLKKIIEGK